MTQLTIECSYIYAHVYNLACIGYLSKSSAFSRKKGSGTHLMFGNALSCTFVLHIHVKSV